MKNFDSTLWPTPNRKTRIQFDLNNSFVSEQSFSYGRSHKEMFKQSFAAHKQLHHTQTGWSIAPYDDQMWLLYETIVHTEILKPEDGSLITQPGFETVNTTYWTELEQISVLSGASADLSNPGNPVVRKSVPSGTNWDTAYNLLDDQTAFPFTRPTDVIDANPTIQMDRIAHSKDNDSPHRSISFGLTVFDDEAIERGELGGIYFTCFAGNGGNGLYRLSFGTNNKAILCECSTNGTTEPWLKRAEFGSPFGRSNGNMKRIGLMILKPACILPNEPVIINFGFYAESDNTEHYGIVDAVFNASFITNGLRQHPLTSYVIPGDPYNNAYINAPIRIDMRQDLMFHFGLRWFKFPTTYPNADVDASGALIIDDAPFQLPFLPQEVVDVDSNPVHNFYLTSKTCKPLSTDTCKFTLHRCDTKAELTKLDDDPDFPTATVYAVPKNYSNYFVRLHIASSYSASSPSAWGWHLDREQVLTNTGQSLWEIGDSSHPKSVILHVDIKSPDRDLNHASANIELADPLNKLTELQTRGGMPMRVVIEDRTDPMNVKSIVPFFGFCDRADHFRRPPSGDGLFDYDLAGYPVRGWGRLSLMCRGVWQLFEENFVDTPFATLFNNKANRQYMVKELIRLMISKAGFKYVPGATDNAFDASFDLDDGPIYASSLDFSKSIDMLDKLADVLKTLARDYLSQFLWHDANTSISSGIWRLKDVPTSPYTNICAFTMDGPNTDSGPKLTHYMPSYGIYSLSESETMPILPIEGGSVSSYVKYPEANWLQISTIQAMGSGANAGQVTSVIKWNPISFNYQGSTLADPAQPEYLGRRLPVYVIDPALGANGGGVTTEAALNALATRISRLAFKAVDVLQFRAPLPFVPHEDYVEGGSTFPYREPRYYDPVLILSANETVAKQYLIRSCNPDFKKDGVQYAMYTCEATREGEDAP